MKGRSDVERKQESGVMGRGEKEEEEKGVRSTLTDNAFGKVVGKAER